MRKKITLGIKGCFFKELAVCFCIHDLECSRVGLLAHTWGNKSARCASTNGDAEYGDILKTLII